MYCVLIHIILSFISDGSHVNTEQVYVGSAGNNVHCNFSKGQSSEMQTRSATKADNLRVLNKPRTPTGEWNKSEKASHCPPPFKTPGAASTPALGTVTKSRTSFVTTPIEIRAHETEPKVENYSVVPEGNLKYFLRGFKFLKVGFSF